MEPVIQSPNQPNGQPLGGTNSNLRYRFYHFHLPLALISAVVLIIWMSFPLFQATGHQGPPKAAQATSHQNGNHQAPPQEQSAESRDHNGNQTTNPNGFENRLFLARFTSATGYVALGLIGLTLLIGPANLLLHRRTPVSSYLARDVGMWAAIMSVIHVVVGLFVHGPPAPLVKRVLFYLFTPEGRPLTNEFGWGNWTGLAATLIVVGLLVISNDFALRKLKARRWKSLQRLNYALFALVLLHAIFYGALLRITSIPTILLGLIASMVLFGQLTGIWLWRRRHIQATET